LRYKLKKQIVFPMSTVPDNFPDHSPNNLFSLCQVLAQLNHAQDVLCFLQDLCTQGELSAMAERWQVCQLLDQGDLSYREIREKTKASLTTITRVAKFLGKKSFNGYAKALTKARELKE